MRINQIIQFEHEICIKRIYILIAETEKINKINTNNKKSLSYISRTKKNNYKSKNLKNDEILKYNETKKRNEEYYNFYLNIEKNNSLKIIKSIIIKIFGLYRLFNLSEIPTIIIIFISFKKFNFPENKMNLFMQFKYRAEYNNQLIKLFGNISKVVKYEEKKNIIKIHQKNKIVRIFCCIINSLKSPFERVSVF